MDINKKGGQKIFSFRPPYVYWTPTVAPRSRLAEGGGSVDGEEGIKTTHRLKTPINKDLLPFDTIPEGATFFGILLATSMPLAQLFPSRTKNK